MRKFALLLVAVLIVAGAWSGGWFYAAGEVRQAVANLGQGDGQTDPKITCGALNVTGFPFRFDIECRDATMVAGDVTTTVAGVRASALVYSPTQAKFSALSPITIVDAFSGAQSRIDFTGAEGSARLVSADFWKGLGGEGWRISRVSLVADGVNWVDTIVGEAPVMSAAHLEAHLLDIPEQHNAAAGTSALAGYAKLTDTAAPSLGIAGGEASLEAELSGLPDDLRAYSGADVMQNWQAAGGQLKLVGLKGTAGEEFVESTGTLGLDSGARVDGQISLRHKGLVERLGTLIPEDWKGLILGGQEADGSYQQTVTIKAGIVFSGIVPVSVIPPLL
jgi:hypothetical protein